MSSHAPEGASRGSERKTLLLILLATLVTYGSMLGAPSLWDIDEAIYADISRNMAQSGDWVMPVFNGGPRFDKPPLLLWMGAAFIRLLGETELAVRLGSLLFALLGVVLVHSFALRDYSRRAADFAALILASNLGWFIEGRMGLLDTALSFFIGWALYHLVAIQRGNPWGYLWMGVALALGVLTKGPVALVLVGGTMLLAVGPRRLWNFLVSPWTLVGGAVFVLLALPWHWAIYRRAGQAWVADYFGYHMFTRFTQPIEDHGFAWYFYLIVLAVGFLPWSGFVAVALAQRVRGWLKGRQRLSEPARFHLAWFATVFLFFSASSTKLPGYILPAFLPLAVLLGAWCDRTLQRERAHRVFEWSLAISAAAGLLTMAGFVALRPMVPPDYMDAYPLLFLVPGTLTAGTLLTQVVHRRKAAPSTLVYGFAVTALAALLVLGTWIVPLAERARPVKPLALAAAPHLSQEARVISAMGDASTTFYLQRPVIYVHSTRDLQRHLKEAAAAQVDAFALIPASMWEDDDLDSSFKSRGQILAAHGFGRLVRFRP